MSIKNRLTKAERAAGVDGDDLIIILRWGDDETPIEELPCTVTTNGQTTTYVYGLNTIPEHLRDGPVKDIQLTWGDGDDQRQT